MEQNMQYVMWLKSKPMLNSHYLAPMNSFSTSWEEQAFAEDAAGLLGGFIWPPRSYSCTFCGREFRSAQALGGHMNVHRRDRAKLKQSLTNDQDGDSPPGSNGGFGFTGKGTRKEELMATLDDDDAVVTNLSVGINLGCGSRNEEIAMNSKRIKSSGSFPSYHKSCSSDRYAMTNSIEDIDLELRLGDSPAIK